MTDQGGLAAAASDFHRHWLQAAARTTLSSIGQLVVSGLLLWAIQWWFFPTWMVSSGPGVESMLQVVPAVIVALYVLVLGSVFVIAQQATTSFSERAVPLVLLEKGVRYHLLRALFLAMAAVVLSGQVPDEGGAPSHAVTAAVTTLAVATVTLLPLSAVVLASLFSLHTDPHAFVGRLVVGDLGEALRLRLTRFVAFKVDVLQDMAVKAIPRGDHAALDAATEGLLLIQREAADAHGRERPGQLDGVRGELLSLMRQVEEALALAHERIEGVHLPSRDGAAMGDRLRGARREAAERTSITDDADRSPIERVRRFQRSDPADRPQAKKHAD
jgi:hypothetical protein